jgi:PAS domain S-box-containing protein
MNKIKLILFLIIFYLISAGLFAERIVVVGCYDYSPLIFQSMGKPAGFFIDILEYIAKKENWKLTYKFGSWYECLSWIENGEIDLLPCTGYSSERAEKLDYTENELFIDWGVLYKKKGNKKINNILNLNGEKISVVKGSIYSKELLNMLSNFGIKAEVIERKEYKEVFCDLENNVSSLGECTNIYGNILEHKYNVERTQILFAPIKDYYSVKKNTNKDILLKINEYIALLKNDKLSIYYEKYDKWLKLHENAKYFKILIYSLIIFFIVIMILFIFIIILRNSIDKKTIEIKESEEKYRLLADKSNAIICEVNEKCEFLYINSSCKDVLGYLPDEMIGRTAFEFGYLEYEVPALEKLKEAAKQGNQQVNTWKFKDKLNNSHWLTCYSSSYKNKKGEIRINVVSFDITAQKQAEDQLKSSLEEKELLLRELYHRTKNNMNIIISYLHLQKNYTNNEMLNPILDDIISRIHTMSLVHQKLYQSKNLSKINLGEYIHELTLLIWMSFETSTEKVLVSFNCDDIYVLIDIAIPVGLVINEILTNILKHAYPENQNGKVEITLKNDADGMILISISDNGIGLPDDFDISRSHSIGMITIFEIVKRQLQGEVEYENSSNGLKYKLNIKNNTYKERI